MTSVSRTASKERSTSESTVRLSLNLDGTGASSISTTVPFYDHMLTALSKHSLIDLTIEASGDTDIDVHHTVEDTAIVLGEALKEAHSLMVSTRTRSLPTKRSAWCQGFSPWIKRCSGFESSSRRMSFTAAEESR